MRGTVTKRGATWSVVVELSPDPVTGKRRQRWHSGYRTKRDAEKARTELLHAVDTGGYVEKSKATVGEYLAEWLSTIEPTVRPTTHASYVAMVRLHTVPTIATVPLSSLDAGHLNALYAHLLANGRRIGGPGGLSVRSVDYLHSILTRAFGDAVKWGRIIRSPAASAQRPRPPRRATPTTWSADQVRAFIDGTADDRMHPVWLLLATTGMRRGEALGLRWSDVDLVAGRANVVQTVVTVDGKVASPPRRRPPGGAAWLWTLAPWRPCVASVSAGLKSGSPSGRDGTIAGWCSPTWPGRPCTLGPSQPRSPVGFGRSDCPPSPFTGCATRGRPWPWPPASTRRSFRSASATPPSPSRSASTATSPPVWTRRLPNTVCRPVHDPAGGVR